MAVANALDLPAIHAELNYIAPPEEKPRRYAVTPPPGVPAWNGVNDSRVASIANGRESDESFTLDRHGFTFRRKPTAFRDYYNSEAVRADYYPEIEAFLADVLGADRVVVFDHNVRNAARQELGARQPVQRVHNDYTYRSAPQRARDLLGPAADRWLARRLLVVNVWRPISGPVLDAPLAVCDARTIRDEDLVATDLVHADRVGETFSVTWSPRHRWYYFPRMQPDEVLLIKGFDSATDGRARLSFHSAFQDPQTPPDAPPRESIEVRTLVFLPH